MFKEKYLLVIIPLALFVIYFFYDFYKKKNMEIVLLDEKDIKNQLNVGLSKEDKYLGQIAQPYPKELQPNKIKFKT